MAVYTTLKMQNHPRYPSKQINRENTLHFPYRNNAALIIKKNKILSFAIESIKLEPTMLNEVSWVQNTTCALRSDN